MLTVSQTPTLGQFLRRMRLNRGLRLAQVAAQVRTRRGRPIQTETLRSIERDRYPPSRLVLRQLVRIYGIDLLQLMDYPEHLARLLPLLMTEHPEGTDSLLQFLRVWLRAFFSTRA